MMVQSRITGKTIKSIGHVSLTNWRTRRSNGSARHHSLTNESRPDVMHLSSIPFVVCNPSILLTLKLYSMDFGFWGGREENYFSTTLLIDTISLLNRGSICCFPIWNIYRNGDGLFLPISYNNNSNNNNNVIIILLFKIQLYYIII